MSHKRVAIISVAGCAVVWFLGRGFVGCVELYAKQKTEWLTACQADGNKRYQCLERWEHMQRGGQ